MWNGQLAGMQGVMKTNNSQIAREAQRKAPTASELSAAQRGELERAAKHPLRLAVGVGTRGFARSSWERKMRLLCEYGLFSPYSHGGYELTEKGLEWASLITSRKEKQA